MTVLSLDPAERASQLDAHQVKTYRTIRERVRDIQEYRGLNEHAVAFSIGWSASSMNRFMREKYVTMPHHVALLLEQLYALYSEDIEEKKRAHAAKLLASVSK
jgi:hypothetical protein